MAGLGYGGENAAPGGGDKCHSRRRDWYGSRSRWSCPRKNPRPRPAQPRRRRRPSGQGGSAASVTASRSELLPRRLCLTGTHTMPNTIAALQPDRHAVAGPRLANAGEMSHETFAARTHGHDLVVVKEARTKART